jgi:hypothetical protein
MLYLLIIKLFTRNDVSTWQHFFYFSGGKEELHFLTLINCVFSYSVILLSCIQAERDAHALEVVYSHLKLKQLSQKMSGGVRTIFLLLFCLYLIFR